MAHFITLTLTQAEARALDALIENGVALFNVGGEKHYRLDGWTKADAARAGDKLREALLGEKFPEAMTLSTHLKVSQA